MLADGDDVHMSGPTEVKRKVPNGNNHLIDRLLIQSTILTFSFVEEKDSFKSINWCITQQSLILVVKTWKFIAFANSLRSFILSEANNEEVQKLICIEKLNIKGIEYRVKVEELNALKKKGIIYSEITIPFSDEELMTELEPQGVKEVYKIQKVDKNSNVKFYTGSVILVFEGNNERNVVNLGYNQLVISNLIPRPMLCSHCGLLGHNLKRCRSLDIEFCKKCFNIHDVLDSCLYRCKNCNKNHNPKDKQCEAIFKEVQVLKIKERHNIGYFDARAIVESSSPNTQLSISGRNIDQGDYTKLIHENASLLKELDKVIVQRNLALVEKDQALEKIKVLEEETIPLLHKRIDDAYLSFTEQFQQHKNFVSQAIQLKVEEINSVNADLVVEKASVGKLRAEVSKLTVSCGRYKEFMENSSDSKSAFQTFIASAETTTSGRKTSRKPAFSVRQSSSERKLQINPQE